MVELYYDLRELDSLSRKERRKVYKKVLKLGKIYTIISIIAVALLCFVAWLGILRPILAVSLLLNAIGINLLVFPYWLYNKSQRWDTPGNRYLTKIFPFLMAACEAASAVTMVIGIKGIWIQ